MRCSRGESPGFLGGKPPLGSGRQSFQFYTSAKSSLMRTRRAVAIR